MLFKSILMSNYGQNFYDDDILLTKQDLNDIDYP